MSHFVKMAQNNAWANDTLHAVVGNMDVEAVWAERPGFFGSIGRTLNHIYEVDLYYVDALERGGRGRSVFARDDLRDMGALHAAQQAVDARFIDVCQKADPQDLADLVPTERKDGMTRERVDWLILHLVQHAVHHRGQVHAMLSHAGVEPPQLDDFYLDYGRVPSARRYWEADNG